MPQGRGLQPEVMVGGVTEVLHHEIVDVRYLQDVPHTACRELKGDDYQNMRHEDSGFTAGDEAPHAVRSDDPR